MKNSTCQSHQKYQSYYSKQKSYYTTNSHPQKLTNSYNKTQNVNSNNNNKSLYTNNNTIMTGKNVLSHTSSSSLASPPSLPPSSNFNKNLTHTSSSSLASPPSLPSTYHKNAMDKLSIRKIPSQKSSIFIHPKRQQQQQQSQKQQTELLTPQEDEIEEAVAVVGRGEEEEEEEEGIINEVFGDDKKEQQQQQQNGKFLTTTGITSRSMATTSRSNNNNKSNGTNTKVKVNKWLYTNEELQNMKKPCRKYISYKEELIKRVKAAQFIKSTCFKLELGHHVLTAATVFLHRYYVRKSIEDEKYQDIGSACIFLATKLFESKDMRKMSAIIDACAKVSMKDNDYVISPSVYGTWERNIIHYEMEVLQVLCFDIDLEQPGTLINNYTNILKTSRALKKYTYCIINDSLSSTLCLRYKWDVIVVAAIYVSSKLLNEPINTNGQKNWWSSFSINETNLKIIIKEILMIYQNEIESNIPTNQSQVTSSSHLNSPPLSNPHPSQTQIVTTPQTLTSELEKRVSSYSSSSEKGMIPVVVVGGLNTTTTTTTHRIPPSPTLSETGESPLVVEKKSTSRKRQYNAIEDSYSNSEKIQKKRINLKHYLKNSSSGCSVTNTNTNITTASTTTTTASSSSSSSTTK